MSVIIRLQGLPWLANAMDIRRFFQGLAIPEGGVHIVGGELGDAFIAFASDEDARQAMQRDSGKIKDTRVKLLLSSRTEMQKVIEQARNPSMGIPAMMTPQQQQQQPPPVPEIGSELRPAERREAGRREHQDRTSVRDKDRSRDRRRRTKSRSRSPRRIRERDGKRKDERNRCPDERDRGKRDDSRKRAEPLDLKQPQKENMASPSNQMMASGSGIGNVPTDNRFGFKQDNVMPPARRNQDQWSSSAPISPWINQPEGFMPAQQQSEQKDWQRTDNDQFGMQGSFGWNNGESTRDTKNDRMGKETFNSRSGESFMNRNMLMDKPNRDQQFSAARNPFSRGDDDVIDRRHSNVPMGRRDVFESRNREFPEGRFGQMDIRNRLDQFGMNGREGNGRRPDTFDAREGNSYDGFPVRRPNSDNFGSDPRRANDHNEKRMDFRGSGTFNDQFDVPEKRPRSGLCVELRGVPYSATPKDVVDFLRGIQIQPNNVKLLGDERSLKVTSALVRLSNLNDLDEALTRNRQYLGNRYIEVVRCSDTYFDNSINIFPDYFNEKRMDDNACVLVKNLPFECKESDISKLFAENNLKASNILLEYDRTGLATGNCFVEFSDAGDAKQASMIKTKLGHKYIDIFMVEKERMINAKSFMEKSGQHGSMMQESSQSTEFIRNTDCCLLQGLPFSATDRDIVRFFAAVNVMPVTIHIMLTKTGQPSGDAFCEFKTGKDCEMALRKNNNVMDNRVIVVKPVSRNEMLDALGLVNKPTGNDLSSRLSYDERMGERHCMNSALMDRSPLDRAPFERLPMSERLMPNERGSHMTGRHSMHEQLSPMDRMSLHERPSSDLLFMHDRRVDRSLLSERSFDRMPLDRHSMMDRLDRGDYPVKDRSMSDSVPRGLQGFGMPGCVVAVQNLPYQASVQDVVNFFRKYNINQESIIRRYNEKGQATGDARIAFHSPADAQQAINEMSMQTMNGRLITLSRVNER